MLVGKKAEKVVESIKDLNERKKGDTGHPLADRVYAWWIDLYTKRGKEFKFSDVVVFKFWCYSFPTIFGYIVFFALFLWLGSIWLKRYGEVKTVIIFMMLIMWRIQILTSIMSQMNKKL